MGRSIYSPQNERLVAWLKKCREDAGLSMRVLSERLDRPHSYVGKVEQQERRLDVVEYVAYCEALGVSAEAGLKIIADAPIGKS